MNLPLALNFIIEPYCNTCVQVFPDCVVWHLWYKIIGGERVQEPTSLLLTSDFSVALLLHYCYSEDFLLICCLDIKVNLGVELMVHMLQKVFVLCKMIWHCWQQNCRPSWSIPCSVNHIGTVTPAGGSFWSMWTFWLGLWCRHPCVKIQMVVITNNSVHSVMLTSDDSHNVFIETQVFDKVCSSFNYCWLRYHLIIINIYCQK